MKIDRDKGLASDELEKKARELLDGSEYMIESGGLFHKTYDVKKKEDTQELLSDGIPVIIENARIVDGETTSQEILLQCLIDGTAFPPVPVSGKSFERLFQDGLLPIEFRPDGAAKARFYITDCLRCQVRKQTPKDYYIQTGIIRRGGNIAFLFPGGAVTVAGITEEIQGTADGSNKMDHYSFTEERDPERWETYRLFMNEAAPHRYSYPVMAFVALAPLCDLWHGEGHDPAFVMNLYGTTGCGKSTLAALASCFYGDFSRNDLPGSFNDTRATTEQTAYKLKDVLYVIDNAIPPESSQARADQVKALSELVRMYGDRDIKGRSWNGEGHMKEQKVFPARGLCMITAEEIPPVSVSNKARLFNVEMTPPEDAGKSRPIIDRIHENRKHLNQIMTEYIQWLLPRYISLTPTLSERFRTLSERINMKHGRLTEAVAHLQTAFMLWSEFLREAGQMSKEDKERADEEAFEIFYEAGERHGELITEDSPPEMFCSSLGELIKSGSVRIDKVNTKVSIVRPDDLKLGAKLVGWCDDDYLYLLYKPALAEVNDLLKRNGNTTITASNRFLKECAEKGFLASENNKTTRLKRVKPGESPAKLVWFYKNKVLSEKEDSEE